MTIEQAKSLLEILIQRSELACETLPADIAVSVRTAIVEARWVLQMWPRLADLQAAVERLRMALATAQEKAKRLG